MALDDRRYTLSGFSAEIDRKPLHFVEPIPPARICSACGHVGDTTGILPCAHFMCKACYYQCAVPGGHICPLDDERCREDDVDWKDFPAENIMKRQVKCWNEANGCSTVLPLGKLTQHFRFDCKHHVSDCPKCSARVLSSDVCAHLRSHCRTLLFSVSRESQTKEVFPGGADCLEAFVREVRSAVKSVCESQVTAFRSMLDDRVGEMRVGLEQLFEENSSQTDRLNALSHDINALRETFNDGLQEASNQSVSNKADLVRLSKPETQNIEEVSHEITALLRCMGKSARTKEWILNGYAELIRTASRQAKVECWSERVYLCGLWISPGVVLDKEDGYVVLHFRLCLEEIAISKCHNWPFEQKIKLSIIDACAGAERHLSVQPVWYRGTQHTDTVDAAGRAESRFYNADLHDAGFVRNDQLLLRLEVLA
ncbi:TNF receptor-associated factor 6-like isoform X2 [Dermacentor andersoni]|uniref:TNF receptor-associated factor 6-like isoform X2 n=1 Tax=Dermacentor andersoni TaxID=34620 RepID=UPI003B3A617B